MEDKCGKVDEQVVLLKQKLRMIYHGEVFNGRPTKTARSHGKKFQGNLGWAYMQKGHYIAAEAVYKKAQMIDPDANKASNLGLCLIKMARYDEARLVVEDILQRRLPGSDDARAINRAEELLSELESRQPPPILLELAGLNMDDRLEDEMDRWIQELGPSRSKRLPIFEEISTYRDQLAC
ncbi:unnamed protein product [Thlaspi arvense]|uniref:Uncharacterized protein n=1 Tax=Thlaspi arvense TaxID=13288 RepID=A0AAU9S625_THLAR|nr:unnamed protein product [Thlaspi arvense]